MKKKWQWEKLKGKSETENGLRLERVRSESENGLREGREVRMEEQRTDASPAPMIPLTIGSDFICFSSGF